MDVIADSFVAIKNASKRKMQTVNVIKSNMMEEILKILKREGYILDYYESPEVKYKFVVKLKYYNGKSVIQEIKKVSKLSRRIYVGVDNIPTVKNNYGIAILTTSKGILTNKEAKILNVGGEVICYIW